MKNIMFFVRILLTLIIIALAINSWCSLYTLLYLSCAAALWVIFGGWEPSGL